MEGSEHSLVPQWLKSNVSASRVACTKNQLTSSVNSDHISYSGFQRSLSSKSSGFSRSYGSSGRSRHDTEKEKDIDNFFDNDKLFNGQYNHDYSDYVNSILSNRFEKDVLQRSKSMNSGRWRENWSPRSSGDVSNLKRSRAKNDDMVAGGVGIMDKTAFEEEFPLLGVEDKHGSSELGGVPSSSSSTQSLLTRTSSVTVTNGLSSTSDDVPVTSTSSVALGTTGLSMAETLAQGPPRPPTPPQLSVGTQKLEELALKQSRLLIPMTPSTPRSLVASPSEKSKVKTGQQQQYPFSYSHSPSRSPHYAPGNSDIQKISSGKSRNVSASQELNGVSLAAKDNSSPSRSRVLSPTGASTSTSLSASSRNSSNNSNPSAWLTLEKRPTFQTESRSDFLKNLSNKSSSTNHCSDDISCALEKSEAGRSMAPFCVNSSTESSCVISENGTASSEAALKFSSNGEKQYSTTKPVLYPDEEIAFLRSLGWEESVGEDEGLTEEEIRDFYEKYLKLQPSSNIL